MKKIILFFFLLGIAIMPLMVNAVDTVPKAEVYFFHSVTCPHCKKENLFLDKLAVKYGSQLTIQKFEISQDANNAKLFQDYATRLGSNANGVPFTIIVDVSEVTRKNERYFIGYDSDDLRGEEIETTIKNILKLNQGELEQSISIPLIGRIALKNMSLPLATAVIGLLDGFNPCAMWTLLFLIGLLLKMQNKKRMWLLGLLFIVASGAVYYVFMAAWLQLLLFLGMITAIRITIGLVGIGLGTINIRDYWKNRNSAVIACKVSKNEGARRTLDRIKEIVYRQSLGWAIVGIIILGFSVNLIELACSAGFPAIYTQLLVLSGLPMWQRYLYMLGYIVFYMLDDMIVFGIAMFTLQSRVIGTRYAKYANLIGGLLIFVLGLLLIFKPQWIMFG